MSPSIKVADKKCLDFKLSQIYTFCISWYIYTLLQIKLKHKTLTCDTTIHVQWQTLQKNKCAPLQQHLYNICSLKNSDILLSY